MAPAIYSDDDGDEGPAGLGAKALVRRHQIDRRCAAELAELRAQVVPEEGFPSSPRQSARQRTHSLLAAEAAALEVDESDRAEMRAVTVMMGLLRKPE